MECRTAFSSYGSMSVSPFWPEVDYKMAVKPALKGDDSSASGGSESSGNSESSGGMGDAGSSDTTGGSEGSGSSDETGGAETGAETGSYGNSGSSKTDGTEGSDGTGSSEGSEAGGSSNSEGPDNDRSPDATLGGDSSLDNNSASSAWNGTDYARTLTALAAEVSLNNKEREANLGELLQAASGNSRTTNTARAEATSNQSENNDKTSDNSLVGSTGAVKSFGLKETTKTNTEEENLQVPVSRHDEGEFPWWIPVVLILAGAGLSLWWFLSSHREVK